MSSTDEEDKSKWGPPLSDAQLAALEPDLRKMAAKYGRCKADWDDLVQAVYLNLLRTKKNWQNVFVVAESAMLTHLRNQNRNGLSNAPPLIGDGPSYEQVDQLQFEELRNLEWLEAEPEKIRAAVMHWAEGTDQSEIAEEFGVSQVTVSNWIAEIRDKLRATVYGQQEM